MAPKPDPAAAPVAQTPDVRRHHARALALGYANERLYQAGDEFALLVHHTVRDERTGLCRPVTPPKWVELLDAGEPVHPAALPAPPDPMAAEVQPVRVGYAAGVASPVL